MLEGLGVRQVLAVLVLEVPEVLKVLVLKVPTTRPMFGIRADTP